MRKLLISISLFLPQLSHAQNPGLLTYQQAVELALKNNYDIQIARNNSTIATIQNNYGNAGLLPKLDLNANGSMANNNTHQEFSNGLSVNKNNVASNNLNAGAYLTWTVFDGMKMFATKERLNLLQQEGELGFKIQLESTIAAITLLYFQIVRQEQLIKGINTTMDVTDERMKMAERRIALGSGSNVELLQAKLDMNAQKSNLIQQKNILNETKKQLLVLTKSDLSDNFSADSNFVFDALPSMEGIRQKIDEENRSLLFSKKNTLVAAQYIRELRSQTLPKVSINSNYLFARSENAAGFALLNQNLGFNAGLSVSWNLFNGSIIKNQIRVADIQFKNSTLESDRLQNSLYANAYIAYMRWQGDKEIADLEEENINLAKQSLTITTERMKLGLGTYLEIKESQSSYEAAITRLVTARYNLKESETTLKKLTGELVK
ncbi:hypothetical protein EMGBS15_17620 [Filimonas sp.]|nr:hypothetical protein EMGBS15_17620 [Filimonas sp.]